ncbi:sensor histidine kinase [Halocella sp. SP3-1]|uniref:sensor histidine kinase n=1 Tax=Halocella sp. SP3-1 TaxID=2382161 RepID=UPI000F75D2E7|nr:sensor histidine kinase [Halocella sp. SP3-1]AZO95865.1 hypothetical protein D7D81_15410 [Halocella sp. SP3-1]
MRKNIVRNMVIILISIIVLMLVYFSNSFEYTDKPEAVNGRLDLRGWDWEEQGILSLNGQWEFYWQVFYRPSDFIGSNVIKNRRLITLPRAWNNYQINKQRLSGDGYATYRLVIDYDGDQVLGIKIPRIFTSYKLWINGEVIASAGKVALNKQQMVPQYLPQVKYFKPETDSIELLIQAANFKHRSGGILESLQIGSASQISKLHSKNLAFELFLFGSLFIIGFYHLALFIFRTKDRSTLCFGIYSLLISFRTLLVGEIYFIKIFPKFNWELAHNIQTLSYYLGVPLVLLFLENIYPDDVSRKINKFIQMFAAVFVLLVLLTPVRVFTFFNPIYQVFSIIVFLYVLYFVAIICYRSREGAYFIGVGVIILILCTLNDIIFLSIILADNGKHFLRNFVSRGNLSSWGLLIFVFAQSLVLARKFSESFSRVELLKDKLQIINANLEEKVEERTLALQKSKEELNRSYLAVSRSEKSLQDLIQNISHDFRTPLSAIKGYANTILDGIIKKPALQEKYLRRIIDKINYLNHMVQELFDLSQLQARQSKLTLSRIPVISLIENLAEKYNFDMKDKDIVFVFHYPSECQNDTGLEFLHVMVDIGKLERVFINLLNNALKYTTEGSNIDLYFNISSDRRKLLVEVSDTGIGIPQVDLPYIFERFYRVSKARGSSNSSGLGLAIVKEIVEYHDGEIWVESELDKGSSFFFTLPIYKTKE